MPGLARVRWRVTSELAQEQESVEQFVFEQHRFNDLTFWTELRDSLGVLHKVECYAVFDPPLQVSGPPRSECTCPTDPPPSGIVQGWHCPVHGQCKREIIEP